MSGKQLLKKDLFGEVWRIDDGPEPSIMRDCRPAKAWLRWLACALMRREANALSAISDIDGVPQLHDVDRMTLRRSYIDGEPMYVTRPRDAQYYRRAMALLRRLHRAGIAHNDLAKEANILVRPDGSPAFIDFQLAWWSPDRSRLFRAAALEDVRHLLKHKRYYRSDLLTQRETSILRKRSVAANLHKHLIKPIYWFVTRKLLRWSDREGAADRGRSG